jgi:hypothetical protein
MMIEREHPLHEKESRGIDPAVIVHTPKNYSSSIFEFSEYRVEIISLYAI